MRTLIAAIGILLGWSCATAAPLAPERVPEPLRPWIAWVLDGHEEARCPPLLGDPETRLCRWPAQLVLRVDEQRATFAQQWLVQTRARVPLPGDATHWPQEVTVDGRPAPVTPDDDVPTVEVEPGSHTVDGVLEWDAIPDMLQVPPATGIVVLVIGGEAVPFPTRDAAGRLWLRARTEGDASEARLDVDVVRLLSDDVPLTLTTRLDLRVAGRSREVLLGHALPAGFVPLALGSPLPARLEPDGRLRVQVRPGNWSLVLTARSDGPATTIARPSPDGPWPEQEVWAFDARPSVRVVRVEGVAPVDPTQTMLPVEWRAYPAYLMPPAATMTLVEERRGDADPAPDRLTLARTWWLDFDGGGYTLHDRLGGTLTRSWRLEMAPPTALGRVAVDGQDQPITRLADDAATGVEVRQGTLALTADARLDGGAGRLPAVGWRHDFAEVSGTLNLPPGWRLFHASGVDDASPTWVRSWTLLDLFLVLVIAMAVGRLWNVPCGLLAFATLGLSYLEPGAPRWAWLWVLAADALARLLPPGRAAQLVRLVRVVALAVLVAIAVTFMVEQVRVAIHPALEHAGGVEPSLVAQHAEPPADGGGEMPQARLESFGYADSAAPAPALEKAYRSTYEVDPRATIGTGPGVPEWRWNVVRLAWSGPVEQTQELRLVLLGPRVNLVLGFLRAALVGALLLRLLRLPLRAAPAIAAATMLLMAPGDARAEFPPTELLDELRTRLVAPPDCAPTCAAVPRLALEVGGNALQMRLQVDAGAPTAVPLPGGAQDWVPAAVLLDGEPARGLSRGADGRLWLAVDPGRHQVVLTGPLPARDGVQLPLPLRPHRVTVQATGWTVDGAGEDGTVGDALQLTRVGTGGTGPAALEPGQLPPFVRVERTITLGLTWSVETTVTRLSPAGAAIALDVPLIAGEAPTSADLRVANGVVSVTLGPQAEQAGWQSVLEQRPQIVLAAPATTSFVEVWRLDAAPLWHVETTGIPVVQQPDGPIRLREWRPWPGERVTLDVTRPAGVPGQTLTIDRSLLAVAPGLRATDVTLTIALRSSQGGQHALVLPPTAALQSLTVDGAPQPRRQDGARVTVPVTPGSHEIALAWRETPAGIASRYESPLVDAGAPSVNATVQIAMPADRWVLLVGGPRLGPAVLFWGLLVVLVVAAIALGRVPLTPLRARHWFLLGLGLTQVSVWVALAIAGWLLALGWRQRHLDLGRWAFDARQLLLVVWTAVALVFLFWSIEHGLLGLPEMQIAGNGSTAALLRWYQDRSDAVLPAVWVVSVPVLVYRLAMLLWALWLAAAVLGWLRWGWDCFAAGGLWRPLRQQTRSGVQPP